MKCPKCGYLGFETTDRCRHCGYDFSLSIAVASSRELPLRYDISPDAPLADFDLDRIIGATTSEAPTVDNIAPAEDVQGGVTPPTLTAVPEPLGEIANDDDYDLSIAAAPGSSPHLLTKPLPSPPSEVPDEARAKWQLFGREIDEAPMTPPPARTPLAVRRATPEITRRRTPRTIRRGTDEFEFELDSAGPEMVMRVAEASAPERPAIAVASTIRRLGAAIIDGLLLGAIDAAVLYLTLAVTGLSLVDVFAIPPIPMLAFVLLLNGGYLIAFTAASGQTIGKMLTGVRVVNDDGGRVDIAGSMLRAAGVLLAIVTLGLPYLPVLLSSEKRALHDRIARTRVVLHA